jgi:hypothetical protein
VRGVTVSGWAAPLLAMSALLAPWIWVVSRVVGGATNHVGFDPRYLAVSTVPAMAWFVRDRGRTVMSRVAVLLAGISVAGLFWLHSSRRLVDYETWLELGMPQPERPARTSAIAATPGAPSSHPRPLHRSHPGR